MKKRIASLGCLIVFAFAFFPARAQQAENFERAFAKAAESGFDSVAVSGLFEKYGRFLMPFNQVMQFSAALKGQEMTKFPLMYMQKTEAYKANINTLLDAKRPDKRMLGYLMVAASGDFAKRNRLSRDLRAGALPEAELWLGMGLMHLGYDHTSDLFQWVVRNNAKAGNYLFPLLLSLPKDSLRQTAYRFADSKDLGERIYAVQTLEYTGTSPKSEKILRKAITSWPVNVKGYAIVPAQALQIGNLLPILKPVLDSAATRKVALDALADSPTPSDRAFVSQLAKKGSTDADVLNALKSSRYEETVIDWLDRLPLLPQEQAYYFNFFRDSVILRNAMLPHLQKAAVSIRNSDVLSNLLPALKGREDSLSQKLLVGYLAHGNSHVRWAAGRTLTGTCSPFLKAELPAIIGNRALIGAETFDLASGCGLDNYQETAEAVYRSTEEYEYLTRVSALNYLATYPQPKHLPIFRDALEMDPEHNILLMRAGARGLATLGDTASLEAIITACEKERKNSDMNTMVYLDAIARLKTARCKTYLESFLKSDSDVVRKKVEAVLEGW
ncbi:hypothetical protein SAMN04487996_11743 [Dyadobacter soli]|uniref:HEAT repeat-containing protein n=1 Tax=Dyadobacter soli TaxID=659014 RepID=A0A1G7SZZ5_9BACT|nr:hypothetical protein [Dyadobacter soli]SDG28637.1 hypothetical protein SAMN04487996_11743 [Dyadobacter soli]